MFSMRRHAPVILLLACACATSTARAGATAPPDTLRARASGATPEEARLLPPVIVTESRLRVPLRENPAATTVVTDALQAMPRTVAADEALRSSRA